MRILCRMFGCRGLRDEPTVCRRCCAHVMDPDGPWVWCGWRLAASRRWHAMRAAVRRLVRLPRCAQCRRRLWPVVGGVAAYQDRFCSERCVEMWLPF